jgi:hypothetical protein
MIWFGSDRAVLALDMVDGGRKGSRRAWGFTPDSIFRGLLRTNGQPGSHADYARVRFWSEVANASADVRPLHRDHPVELKGQRNVHLHSARRGADSDDLVRDPDPLYNSPDPNSRSTWL